MLPISRCNTVGFRLTLGIALLLTTLLAIAPQPEIIAREINDKLGHAAVFLVLAFLADASWPDLPFDWRKALPLMAYGILLECLQYFTPTRFFSGADMVADAVGIAAYLILSIIASQLGLNRINKISR